MAHLTSTSWLPESQPERQAVLEQMERLFGHLAFKNSKRSQSLLRYLVEQSLGVTDYHPKERTLGIEVFGQEADYDTSARPIVRVVATEIRRRLAQYYDEPGHEGEIRIELPQGSYTPEFHLPTGSVAAPAPSADSPMPARSATELHEPMEKGWSPYAISACLLGAVLFGALIGIAGWRMAQSRFSRPAASAKPVSSALNQFWGPIIDARGPVQIVVGTWRVSYMQQAPLPSQGTASVMDAVVWPDLAASSKIIGLLDERQKAFRVEDVRSTTFSDLTQSPVVLIGGFNNPLALSFVDRLRFHFMRKGDARWIADRNDPTKKYFTSGGAIPGSSREYAIIARFYNSGTSQFSVIVAGRGGPATTCAGDFVTNDHDMENLVKRLPKGWQSKNIEVLLSLDSLNYQPGAAHIAGVDLW